MKLFIVPRSLKKRLILYFTIVTFISSFFICFYYYYYSSGIIKKNMISNAMTDVTYIMANIDKQVKYATTLSDWLFINKTFENVLTYNNQAQEDFNYELINDRQIVTNMIINTPIYENISSIIICGNNNVDIRIGDEAYLIDKNKLQKEPWFIKSMEGEGSIYLPGIVTNPSVIKTHEYIIPIVRPIVHSTLGNKIGWNYIALKESIISDVFKQFNAANGNSLYILDANGICISSTDGRLVGKSMSGEEFISHVLQENSNTGHFDKKAGAAKELVVYYKSNITNWKIVQTLSYAPLYEQSRLLQRTTFLIFFVSILISYIFAMFLSSNLTNPLKRILNRLKFISEGSFERDCSIEGSDEIGQLGKGINEMAFNIDGLLQRVKDEEREKRKLELEVLQNQVNPHFLYNTLNSIKWMATIQKADGIRDMVGALGRLIMNISRNSAEQISLREEISLTEDYLFIQNIRYSGKIKAQYFISDDSLLDNTINKFTLQPIVENAIFHGIEPKKDAGLIKISVEEEEDTLIICVEDDGVGVDTQTIGDILNGADKNRKRGMSGIGIRNVNERIKLNFGNRFGLSIESVCGEYTKVYIRIPKSIKEKTQTAGDADV